MICALINPLLGTLYQKTGLQLLDQKSTAFDQELYWEILEEIRQATTINWDDTGWFVNGI